MIDRENPKKQYFYGYIITNKKTGKEYVGITSRSVKVRWNQHKSGAKNKKYYLYRSMRKHGVDSFSIKEIVRTNSHETIEKWEVVTILARNTFAPDGYNLTLGGEGVKGYKYTKEQNKANSERIKKIHKDNPEIGKKHSAAIKQYYVDNPEARERKRQKQQRYFKDNPEARTRFSETMSKYWFDPEWRAKQSQALKNFYKNNHDACEKMSKNLTQMYKNHPEMVIQCSERMKQYYIDNPEAIERNKQRQQQYYKDNPEKKQKISELKKKWHKDNPEIAKTQSEKTKGNKYRAIPVLYFNKFFRSTREAASFNGVTEVMAYRNIKKQTPGCQKLIKGQEYNWEIPCY